MKKSSIILLQVVIILIGITALAFMLWEPHIEGRNVNATLYQIYFNDPFLAYMYVASISFFIALYKVFRVLGYIRQNKTFSVATVKALRTIKYCGITLVAFILGAEVWLFVFQRGKDDIAGGVFMGLLIIAGAGLTAIVASMFEKLLQNAVDLQSENDLTV